MESDLLPITLKIFVPTPNGTAVFLGDDAKTFLIYMDNTAGQTLADTISGEKKDRPMTHDLIANIFLGFGVSVERVVINHVNNGIFHARLLLSMRNELGAKFVEIDARPSDSLILAARDKKPILVTRGVYDAVDDMSELMRKVTQGKKS